MSFHIIIPARFDSSRFPGKVLEPIDGQPMLQWVWNKARQSGADSVTIATDHERVCTVATEFGATVMMTSGQHSTGTDRLVEAATQLGFSDDSVIVNVQADEPTIPPALIQQVAHNCLHYPCDVATLCEPIDNEADKHDPNIVKVVSGIDGQALYFSRAPIPHHGTAYRHIGLYAYRASFLSQVPSLQPCVLEKAESLEQLRWLSNGKPIHVDIACARSGNGIDTPADLFALKVQLEME
jgi:3-deoxy-manno-octulosonate cytidylyltransferase (CMP-KDO synthetase)